MSITPIKKRILITGASGFLGSHIVEEALRKGYDVWAGIRESSSRAFLTDERIHFLPLNLDSQQALELELSDLDPFDYVIHAAGVTKCLDERDFERVNVGGTANLVKALINLKMPLKRFVYISSLSVMGPVAEQTPHALITDDLQPQPNTAYGRSKLKAEQFLDQLDEDFPYVILRPTGIYGPRERDYLMQMKSIKQHIDFAVGYKQQDLTFIYVGDMAEASLLACDYGVTGHKYFLSDGKSYTSRQFSDLVCKELGEPWVLRVTAPLWVLRIVTWCGNLIGQISGKVTALNNDKYNIMRQRNWRCNIELARNELGFEPLYMLEDGVRNSIFWYKEQGWM